MSIADFVPYGVAAGALRVGRERLQAMMGDAP
jgi:hypothetical protein